jgi:subtilisin family serine protease
MNPLELVKLQGLMALSSGVRDIGVAVMDGPVAKHHPDLAGSHIQDIAGGPIGTCAQFQSSACAHGTFIAGILVARRGSRAPAICPGCTLLLRPIFQEVANSGQMPTTTPEELAQAIVECVDAGARVLNLSAATAEPSMRTERRLQESLHYAARRGALVVAAAGNQGTLGSSAITRHPWVIPVAACDSRGRAMSRSNLGNSIGRRGLAAPGEAVESLGVQSASRTGGGTSSAAAFVTGTIALLWSEFPSASAAAIRHAVTHRQLRTAVTPPVLDAGAAYGLMAVNIQAGTRKA